MTEKKLIAVVGATGSRAAAWSGRSCPIRTASSPFGR